MKNNSFSLESTANPLFFVDYMKSQVKIEEETDLTRVKNMGSPSFAIHILKISSSCSQYKMFPQEDVKMTKSVALDWGLFQIHFHYYRNYARKNDNQKTPKQQNLIT